MRTKTVYLAPEGVGESCIEGTYYFPEENDRGQMVIESTNAGHKAILTRHGYAVIGEIEIIPPARAMGLIDLEELGRSGLAEALAARRISFPTDASRGDLVEIAAVWNSDRRKSAREEAGVTGHETLRARTVARAAEPAPVAAREPLMIDRDKFLAGTAAAAQDAADETEALGLGAPPPDKAPPAPAPVDFSATSYQDLKGWAASHGVDAGANPKKADLVAACQKRHADILAAKKAA